MHQGWKQFLLYRWLLRITAPLLLIVIGTIGYVVLEGWPWFDALYMTVITLTTVGYGETYPLSYAGRWFTIFLLLGGVFTIFYSATSIIAAVVSGEVQAAFGRQRMETALAQMKDHVIVCGYGRMGQLICEHLIEQKLTFVVIEKELSNLEGFDLVGGVPLHGDATSDDALQRAGVDRARALIAAAASDADNLYITLSARLLNDKLFIVARSEEESAQQKMVRAGANRVVSPYRIGGMHMALATVRPTVLEFFEVATRAGHLELQLEESQLTAGSALVGATLRDQRIRQQLGVIIVAIKNAEGEMLFNPPPETVLQAGDVLVVLGDRGQLDQLERIAKGEATPSN
jgi:voltage-gated potassium channel